MAVGHIKLGKCNFTFVFRHRFEKPDEVVGKFRYNHMFRQWELGLWFRKNKIVGRKDFQNVKKWNDNLVGSYMLGINLLLCKAWVEFNRGGMEIEID